MDLNNKPHRRKNILTGEWTLVSPHRTKRPWQGKNDKPQKVEQLNYDSTCYLCPGNERVGGVINPNYNSTYIFKNDFSALTENLKESSIDGLLEAESESGICKVMCYSPNHSLTIPLMEIDAIKGIIRSWQKEYRDMGKNSDINYVQIFENKGAIMGCSNPHPHGQIWAQRSIPQEVQKKIFNQKNYWKEHESSLLSDYLKQELKSGQRIILENNGFAALVPFWAVWPFETMIIPKRHVVSISELSKHEVNEYASILKKLTIRYDNLFETSFPYSTGIHQAPTDGKDHKYWHMHMSFYPPLLRSADIKKFMVGYEMFANPQRDITAEQAAKDLKNCSEIHYLYK